MKTFIVSDPNILGGKPVIKGTRIPVARIAHLLLSEGYLPENISEQYPQVNIRVLRGAITELINDIEKCYRVPQVP